jgi:NADH-quinone oxidoreductase subunit M
MGFLSLLVVIPATGAVVAGLSARLRAAAKALALTFSTVTLVVALAVWARADFSSSDFQFVELFSWIPSLGVSYLLGVDAISLFFVLMTAVLTPVSVLSSWGGIRDGETAFFSILLFLEAAVIGAFLAVDVFLFYLFWLLALVALVLLVGVWGGPRRRRAALSLGVLTVGGSLVMLLVILVCHHTHFVQSGSPSFDTRHWEGLVLTPMAETWLFWGLFLAFAIQTPLFPFHIWLTGAAQESPAGTRVLASTVLLKIGIYGLVRFAVPWFPRAAWTFAPAVMSLAVVSVLVGAVAAALSIDSRKLAARVSVAHMGVVLLGIFSFVSEGVKSAYLIAIGHGFFVGGLIFMTEMIRERTGSFRIEDHRGLGRIMPFGWLIAMLLMAGAVAIPVYHGLEIIRVAFERAPVQAAAAAVGLAVLAVAFARVARISLKRREDRQRRALRGRELLVLVPLALLVVWMGIAPGGFLRSLDAAAGDFVSRVSNHVVLTEQ